MTRENKSDWFVKLKYKQILRIKNDPVKSTEICLPACDSAYVSVFKLTLDLFGWWSSCDKQAKRFSAVLNIRSRQKKCAWKNGFVFEVRKGKSNNLNRSWHYCLCSWARLVFNDYSHGHWSRSGINIFYVKTRIHNKIRCIRSKYQLMIDFSYTQ